ncbi:KH domain-containing protein [bacterium]|nr:KH domain-containing protein [bacterium]
MEERENSVYAEITNTDSGLLIGFKGETLKALQHLMRLIIFSKLGEEAPNVVIDVEGYRKDEEERLRSYIVKVAEIVKETGKQEELSPATSYKRMLIHTYVQDVPGVVSESIGEGAERRIVIKPE